jgi:hypothetical protein
LSRTARYLLSALLVAAALFTACKGGEEYVEPEAFSFVIYPGSRYLGQISEATKSAHKLVTPGTEPPPIAIYDTDAPLDTVAEYYREQYGYKEILPSGPANPGAAGTLPPPAYRRSGDLASDAKAIEALVKQLGLGTDVTKAAGAYQAVEISPRPNRPRVTIQRPYFDVTTSQVVDRTLILMSK